MVQATLGERSLEQSLSPADFQELVEGMRAAARSPGVGVALRELVLHAADGRELRVDVRLADIDLGPARVVEISMRDVTRERAMERQLSISERLSSIGLLTAGVAHEINNPLEGIANYLNLLENRGPRPSAARATSSRCAWVSTASATSCATCWPLRDRASSTARPICGRSSSACASW